LVTEVLKNKAQYNLDTKNIKQALWKH